jgi:hypothetical protein
MAEESPVVALHSLLEFAIANNMPGVFAINMLDVLGDSARQNDKRPAWVRVMVPDQVVMNITGKPNLRDHYFVVHVPREVVDRFESPLILPV